MQYMRQKMYRRLTIVGIEFQLKVRVPLLHFVFFTVAFITMAFPADAHREVVLSIALGGTCGGKRLGKNPNNLLFYACEAIVM